MGVRPRTGWPLGGAGLKQAGVGVAVVVVALTLVTPGAAAQNSSAWLTPKDAEPRESDGEVVLTVSMWRAGRVLYRTFDGLCTVGYSPQPTPAAAQCRDDKKARAPDDYSAVSGELVFTEGGTKTITIPIVDDAEAEGEEGFTVAAWEDANADPWLPRGDSALVRIADDEVGSPQRGTASAAAAGPATNASGLGSTSGALTDTGPAGGQSSGPADGASAPPSPGAAVPADRSTTATTTTTLRSPGVKVTLSDGGFRQGPGFELTGGGGPGAAPRVGGGGGAVPGLAIGSGTEALAVGALAFVQRRRRWSPTRA